MCTRVQNAGKSACNIQCQLNKMGTCHLKGEVLMQEDQTHMDPDGMQSVYPAPSASQRYAEVQTAPSHAGDSGGPTILGSMPRVNTHKSPPANSQTADFSCFNLSALPSSRKKCTAIHSCNASWSACASASAMNACHATCSSPLANVICCPCRQKGCRSSIPAS